MEEGDALASFCTRVHLSNVLYFSLAPLSARRTALALYVLFHPGGVYATRIQILSVSRSSHTLIPSRGNLSPHECYTTLMGLLSAGMGRLSSPAYRRRKRIVLQCCTFGITAATLLLALLRPRLVISMLCLASGGAMYLRGRSNLSVALSLGALLVSTILVCSYIWEWTSAPIKSEDIQPAARLGRDERRWAPI